MSRFSPRDSSSTLRLRSWGPVEVDFCERTGGIWLDANELDALAEWFHDGDDFELHGQLFAGKTDDTLSEGPCPACKSPSLREHRIPTADGPSNVKLDICSICFGIWIDGPEVSEVRRVMIVNRTSEFVTRIEVSRPRSPFDRFIRLFRPRFLQKFSSDRR